MAHRVEIAPADGARRLDRFLAAYLREAPPTVLHKLLRKKRIKLNSARADGHEILSAGDVLDFYLAPETLATWRGTRRPPPKAAPLTGILYEDAQILVVNKPAGLPAHGGKRNHGGNAADGDHLLARVLWYLYETGAYDPAAAFTPALCHRLDVNTSGLVVCGKTLAALQYYAALLRGDGAGGVTGGAAGAPHGMVKEYLTVTEGTLRGEATLTGTYEKDETTNTARISPPSGGGADTAATGNTAPPKQAITYYKSLATGHSPAGKPHTLLLVRPVTGRSHQIRAHLAAVGHPPAGDRKYGGTPTPFAPAQLLHAWRLEIPLAPPQNGTEAPAVCVEKQHGTDAPAVFTAPLPEGFARCLREWFGVSCPTNT